MTLHFNYHPCWGFFSPSVGQQQPTLQNFKGFQLHFFFLLDLFIILSLNYDEQMFSTDVGLQPKERIWAHNQKSMLYRHRATNRRHSVRRTIVSLVILIIGY